MITAIPGQAGHKRADQIDDTIANDDIVVETDKRGHEYGTHADAFEYGRDLPDFERATLGVLTDSELEKEQRKTDKEKHDNKSDHERRATVLKAQERKAPHIAQADSKSDTSHQKLDRVVPVDMSVMLIRHFISFILVF